MIEIRQLAEVAVHGPDIGREDGGPEVTFQRQSQGGEIEVFFRRLVLTPMLKGVLPTRLFYSVAGVLGVNTSMTGWKGRGVG